ncbi:RxLR effector protein [Phytophthora megakarya]|uniref:RxLR effector protein n=1 Tax=Phytophthora megakarya TaxID=4795 RepID=A0A225VUS4_9STRA|nr:RxLR effector protein [Phytophthora megakarya]
MLPTSRTPLSMYIALLTSVLVLVCSVTAHLEQTTEIAEIPQDRLPGVGGTTTRFLRAGNMDHEVVNGVEDERANVIDYLFKLPLYKLRLKNALKNDVPPLEILRNFEKIKTPPNVEQMVLWVRYALSYRAKMGYYTVDDVHVAQALKDYVAPNLMPHVFRALEKDKSLVKDAVALKEWVVRLT